MTHSEIQTLRDDISGLRGDLAARFAETDAKLAHTASRSDIWQTVFIINGGFLAVIGLTTLVYRSLL